MSGPNLTFTDKYWHRLLGRPYRLHVVDHGGDLPVVVLLHGLGSSSANWDELIPLLTPNYRCITIDLLGFGESPKPQWTAYTMKDHVRALHATLNRLRLHQPYILLGHSLGSLLATRYARDHGTHITHLILLSPPVYAPLTAIQSRSARQRTSFYLGAYKFLRTHRRANADNIVKLMSILPEINPITITRETWLPFIRSLEQCIENQTLISDIRDVAIPIDIFYGVFDEVLVPYSIKRLAKIQDVQLHPLPVNHLVGKRYAAAVATFLGKATQ